MQTKPTKGTLKRLDRALAVAERLGYKIKLERENRVNPFSGVSRELEPSAIALYDFITTRRFVCGRDYTRSEWDNARLAFRLMWPDEYMDLID